MVGGSITATSGNALIVEGGTANLNAEGGKDLNITGDITHDDSTGFIPWKPAETTDPSITPGIS